jgi:Holliday junction resolvase-like predicted endonuclease
LLRAAAQLLQQHKELAKCKVRFDVIVVHRPASPQVRVEWIKHAFAA